MKVVHVITTLADGGAEAVLVRLIQALPEVQHSVVSLSGMGKYGLILQSIGVCVLPLHMDTASGKLTGFFRLISFLRKQRPDAVQTWMYHANFLGGLSARFANVPAIHWGLHSSAPNLRHNTVARWVIIRLGAALSSSIPASIASCSEAGIRRHAQAGYESGKLKFIPNGYPTDVFRPDAALRRSGRAAFNLSDSEIVIGTVARLDFQKDHPTLLRALSILKERHQFKCILVGHGVDKDEHISELIATLGLGEIVSRTGARSDIPCVMNVLDLLISSSSMGEAFPNVLCEAMACGTPCVTTDVGDSGYIVGDTGWVTEPGDAKRLADALDAALLALPDQERSASARSRVVQNFSVERMAASYLCLWQGGSLT